MKNIGFIYTEFQYNILAAICQQENIKLDHLFIRKGLNINLLYLKHFTKSYSFYENTSMGFFNIPQFYKIFKKDLAPFLNKEDKYNVFTWSVDNPVVNPIINYVYKHCKIDKINIFEDGTGSYILKKRNFKNKLFLFIYKLFVFFHYPDLRKKHNIPITGWSLIKNSFPYLKLKNNKIIDVHNYKNVLLKQMPSQIPILENNSNILITSPFVEYNILSEIEYLKALETSIKNIQKSDSFNNRIYIKPHPRNNINKLKTMLDQINKNNNIKYIFIDNKQNIEFLALKNEGVKINYFSNGSSSLYVIKTLQLKNASVYLIKNNILEKSLKQLYAFYRNIEIYEK
jgi:hypothetical protein